MIERAVLEYVANSVWQVPLLAGTAWLAIRAGKPEPRVQYRMWVGTLALAVILPAVQPAAFRVHILRARQNPVTTPTRGISINASLLAESTLYSEEDAQPRIGSAPNVDADGVSRPAKSEAATFPYSIQLSEIAWDWLLGIYFAIVLLRLAQLVRSRRAAGRLLQRARKRVLSPLEQAVLEGGCEKLGVAMPRVLFSGAARTPMAMGSRRPAVLLPESFHACSEAEMQAILCHELAHVRRGDYLANWICQLGSLPIAYHPATYGIDREIRRSRELTCDAIAAAAMASPVEYAGCLVGLARRIDVENAEDGAAGARSAAAGLFDHDVFEERIMKLLETKARNAGTAAWRMTGAGALIAGAVVCAIALHITPVVRAADTTTTVQQTTSAQAKNANQAGTTEIAPARKHARIRKHAVVAVKMTVPVKAIVPVHAAMPVEMTMPVTAVAPVHAVMPVKVTLPVQVAMPILAEVNVRAVVPIGGLAGPVRIVVPAQDTPQAKPAPPTPPSVPKTQSMPPAPNELATPVPPIAAQQPAPIKPPAIAQPETDSNGVGIAFHLTPAQRARMDRELAAAAARVQAQTKVLNSPEFKAQMAEMHRQIEAATKDMRSAEFQAQIKALQSPAFKKQMADMRLQIQEATKHMRSAEIQRQMKYLQSPEYKKQMADMQRQIQQATQQLRSAQFQAQMKYMQSPEFKKQMADMQQQIQEAAKQIRSAEIQRQMKYLQSPEFKKQMEDAQRQIQEATKNLEKSRMHLDMKQQPKRETPGTSSGKVNPLP